MFDVVYFLNISYIDVLWIIFIYIRINICRLLYWNEICLMYINMYMCCILFKDLYWWFNEMEDIFYIWDEDDD